jgi:hypothetical protein
MKKKTPLLFGLILGVFFGYLVWIRNSGATAKATADAQTQAVVATTTAFLNSLSADQRKKVQFPFTLQKTATAARFSRSGIIAGHGSSGGPQGGGPGAGFGGGPGGPPDASHRAPGSGSGMGPAGGFVGEKYGEAIWSNYPVSDVPRPGLQLSVEVLVM